ncbi:hypothetical protein PHISCL_02048 [Aspergillus sclerotialis]|uniref:Uncharacterized protein n=1 Tax=Aspergillus sclerotialis TaxID=2070753 RepID=A0A3A3A885_9EURO|nr:hypothetical protein PHISCL_02048 [Aspergillus sclerotialis]
MRGSWASLQAKGDRQEQRRTGQRTQVNRRRKEQTRLLLKQQNGIAEDGEENEKVHRRPPMPVWSHGASRDAAPFLRLLSALLLQLSPFSIGLRF